MTAASLAARAVASAVLCALLGLVMVSALPTLLGWRSTVVLSGSMQPGIRAGDVVASAPAGQQELTDGQVVLVRDPVKADALLMHRLVSQSADGSLVTKGDANLDQDSNPVRRSDVVGLPRLRIPYIGLPVLWMHEGKLVPAGASVLGLVCMAGLAVGSGAPAGAHRRQVAPHRTHRRRHA